MLGRIDPVRTHITHIQWFSQWFIAVSMLMVAGVIWLTAAPAAAQVTPHEDIEWLNVGGSLYGDVVGWSYEAFGMGVDGAGNTTVLLRARNDATFTSTTGSSIVHPVSQGSMLLARYDSSGRLLWVETVINDDQYWSFGDVVVDASGNAVVSGAYNGTVQLGTGSQPPTVTATQPTDYFLMKVDPAGQLVWTLTQEFAITQVEMDSAGNIYVVSTATADDPLLAGVAIPGDQYYVEYVAKYSPAGNLVWLTPLSDDRSVAPRAMEVTDAGIVVISGFYFDTPTFGSGTNAVQLGNSGNTDMFVAQFDATGTLDWVIQGGGSGYDEAVDLALDPSGNVYVTGIGSPSQTLIDVTGAVRSVSSSAAEPGVLWKVDASGNHDWVTLIDNQDFIFGGYAVAVNASGTVAVTGDVGQAGTTFRSAAPATTTSYLDTGGINARATFVGFWSTEGVLNNVSLLRGTDVQHDGHVEFGPDGDLHLVSRISLGATPAADFPVDGQQDMVVMKLRVSKLCQGLPVTVDIGAGERPTEEADVILGTSGADVINARGGDDTICGGAGNDLIVGGDGNDVIDAEAGNDRVWGGLGNDLIWGRAGIDRIRGGAGDDSIWGGADRDVILGEAGIDSIWGEAGRDSLYGGDGPDMVDGGADTDLVRGQGGADLLLTGPSGNDRLVGGDGNDTLDGRATTGSTRMLGEAGNDTFYGAEQLDRMWGGDGDDIMYGRGYNDLLRGGAGNDRLYGQSGRDTLDGGDGNDQLYGGDGDADKMVGMAGSDTCVGGLGVDDFAHATCESVA